LKKPTIRKTPVERRLPWFAGRAIRAFESVAGFADKRSHENAEQAGDQIDRRKVHDVDSEIVHSEGAAEQIVPAAGNMYGKPYDIFFSFNNDAIYCSELPYLAYRAAGISIGKIQKGADLHVDNFLGLPRTSNDAIEGWMVASLE
jgi:hypothetical protein